MQSHVPECTCAHAHIILEMPFPLTQYYQILDGRKYLQTMRSILFADNEV